MMDIPLSKTIHFIGIGGCGMSAIARILIQKGYSVSGSDLKENAAILRLKDMGAKIYLKHDEKNVRKADVVVVSTAIKQDNSEFLKATSERLPIYHRSQILSMIMDEFSTRIAVAGTHGKTTTTAMMARTLDVLNLSPTYVIGGEMVDFKCNSSLGTSQYFVAEADESDGSFLNLNPNVAIVTNIEAEHMDHYGTEPVLRDAFLKFMSRVIDDSGVLVVNQDDPQLFAAVSGFPQSQVVSYGITTQAMVRASDIKYTPAGAQYQLSYKGVVLGPVQLRVFGAHNVSNSLAIFAYGLHSGFSFKTLVQGLFKFSGTKRRFQHIGSQYGVDVYDDYGHHPTEIETTLKGIKDSFNRRLVCIFQPHRYSRTRDLIDVFPHCFSSADELVITDIYSANESNPDQLTSQAILDKMTPSERAKATFVPHKSDIALHLLKHIQDGDMIITMGAGDIHTVGTELLQQLRLKDANS